ncbi:hypothetical protein BSKO_12974 [Bryopsis sp. KO-2023]|nr:hypothetical protein BSKO_12974 [Bryopsis sp. KO-2023]
MILALPFVRLADLDDAMGIIERKIQDLGVENRGLHRNLVGLVAYVKRQWIRGPYPPQMWNVFDQLGLRTTNNVEGFHSKLNRLLVVHHPNIFKLIQELKREDGATVTKLSQIMVQGIVPYQRKKYRGMNDRLKKHFDAIREGTVDLTRFLKLVSEVIPSMPLKIDGVDDRVLGTAGGGTAAPPLFAAAGGGTAAPPSFAAAGGGTAAAPPLFAAAGGGTAAAPPLFAAAGGGTAAAPPLFAAAAGGGTAAAPPLFAAAGGGTAAAPPLFAAAGGGTTPPPPLHCSQADHDTGAGAPSSTGFDLTIFPTTDCLPLPDLCDLVGLDMDDVLAAPPLPISSPANSLPPTDLCNSVGVDTVDVAPPRVIRKRSLMEDFMADLSDDEDNSTRVRDIENETTAIIVSSFVCSHYYSRKDGLFKASNIDEVVDAALAKVENDIEEDPIENGRFVLDAIKEIKKEHFSNLKAMGGDSLVDSFMTCRDHLIKKVELFIKACEDRSYESDGLFDY